MHLLEDFCEEDGGADGDERVAGDDDFDEGVQQSVFDEAVEQQGQVDVGDVWHATSEGWKYGGSFGSYEAFVETPRVLIFCGVYDGQCNGVLVRPNGLWKSK